MTRYHASLPMYDLPECREDTDALWHSILAGLHAKGADLLVEFHYPQTEHDAEEQIRHPRLLLSQTCWGPISLGLTPDLHILAQPDFSEFEGGNGPLYRSAIIATGKGISVTAPKEQSALIPIERLSGKKLAFNERASLSGYLSVTADMTTAMGQRKAFYDHAEHSGSHRHSIEMVAKGAADVAAIDCKTWALLQNLDENTKQVHVIGWTAPRKGLPYVCSPKIDDNLKELLTEVLVDLGSFAPN